MSDTLLLQKEVDKSVLFQGLTIPQAFHDLFFERIGFRLAHGENHICFIQIWRWTKGTWRKNVYGFYGNISETTYE